jgi:hypothetical protein
MSLPMGRLTVASVVGLPLFLGAARAASATTVSSVKPAEGCPGDVVTFLGSGFKTSGHGAGAAWSGSTGIREQFGDEEEISESLETDTLITGNPLN